VYKERYLDSAKENPTIDLEFDRCGLLLEPERVYLFNSDEVIGSTQYVPIIRGRSSIGRLGVFIHITADLIDIGSINQVTLQLHAVSPVRVYPGMLIGQVTFWVVEGKICLYSGKYASVQSPCASLAFRDIGSACRGGDGQYD
jgi:dCTP deaminase